MKSPYDAILLLCAATLACAGRRPVRSPIPTLRETDAGGGSPCLVVFLPGRRDHLGAFRRHGFPQALEKRGVRADSLEVDAHLAYYENGTIVERLREDVVARALAQGRSRIWLVGISLGGLGAVLYGREHPEEVAGLVLLAPYLGEGEVLGEVTAAGLRAWRPGPSPEGSDRERDFWRFLKSATEPGAARSPAIYLGYGVRDDLASSDALLAQALPEGHVFTTDGRHNWSAWKRLWKAFLDSGALSKDCRGE